MGNQVKDFLLKIIQAVNMCCNNAFVAKGHEIVHSNEGQVQRMKSQSKYDRDQIKTQGEMNITDRKDNE